MRPLWALAVTMSAVVLICVPRDSYAEGWLCIAEQSAGFNYNAVRKKWESTIFRTDAKFIIRKPIDSDLLKGTWVVAELGDKITWVSCENDVNEWGYLYCRGPSRVFNFNTDNQRFMWTYSYGYYSVVRGKKDEDSDTPYMEIGRCSPI